MFELKVLRKGTVLFNEGDKLYSEYDKHVEMMQAVKESKSPRKMKKDASSK